MLTNVALTITAWATSRWSLLARRVDRERGQDIIEYSVLVGGIALALMLALFTYGPGAGMFDWFVYKVSGCINFQSWACGE